MKSCEEGLQDEVCGLAGCQGHALELHEPPDRLDRTGDLLPHVQLDYRLAVDGAGVGDSDRSAQQAVPHLRLTDVRDVERRVRQAVTEGEQRTLVGQVRVPVGVSPLGRSYPLPCRWQW